MVLFTTMLRRIRLLNLSANNNLTSAGSGFAVLSAAEKVMCQVKLEDTDNVG